MSDITRRNDPFWGMAPLHEAMNQLLSESFVRPSRWSGGASWAALDVYETENGYVARLAVPGLKADNFDITAQQNTLTITGKVSSEKPENAHYLVQEQLFGEFTRTVQFPTPVNVDKIEAHLADGILTLNVPKAETAVTRRISVKNNA
jgi:HSP20 family protein